MMARKSRDWEEGLSDDLWNEPENRIHFIQALEEEGLSFIEAISRTVSVMGLTRYAEEIGMDKGNLCNALKPEGNPTVGTIERIIGPLGIQLGSRDKRAG
jgi:DNA-binding phage protein